MLNFLRFVFKYKNKTVDRIMLYISLICAFAVIFHVGYITDPRVGHVFEQLIHMMFYFLFILTGVRVFFSVFAQRKIKVEHYSGLVISMYFFFIILARFSGEGLLDYFAKEQWIYVGIYLLFIAELSKSSLFFDNFYFNPTILFVISFLALILIATVLLMLPRTTLIAPLSFVDALFMATSAVCITGLSVTDISTNFTFFGQSIILILIQVGGLGIMTFTGFFGYFFSGGFSFKNQLMFGEILGQNKVGSVISTLLTIIYITLLFEFVGAIFIFFSLDPEHFESVGMMIFFAVFHSVSAFCNAGFSILSEGIHNDQYRFNYNFQIWLSILFIFGGLGFSIVLNFYTYAKSQISYYFHKYILKRNYIHKAWAFTFNSKFILICNIVVILVATLCYYFLEHAHSLQEDKSISGEWISAFFMANASRSAGFNSVDLSFVQVPTVIFITILMWIGTSPGSTGGGVKVTTVAIAFMNIVSLAKGKEHIELFKRRIVSESVNKAFAIILLSILTIGASFILLNFTDPDKSLKDLLFETVSAYSTCGLSLGVSPSLSLGGKLIITFTMFIGRVGALTLLVAIIKNTKNKQYIYPSEKIMF